MKPVSKDDNFYFYFYALLVLFFGCAVMQQFYPQGQKTILFLIIITLTMFRFSTEVPFKVRA